ncbi:MAG: hypothetical protein GY898_32330 [Proteobacteria bacterium]|nr:hypothetical protein [Pseudomonadota bacterium]
MPEESRSVVATAFAVLTFRASPEELGGLDRRHLRFGLLMTWLAGMGRYWDNPKADLLQNLGVGSLVYVFALSALLWITLRPLTGKGLRYEQLLTFVTLTATPAVIYAIPVERFMALGYAQTVNVWFLAVVATWRVALLAWFLRRALRLRWFELVVATTLPLTLIVVSLTILNLEHVVFNIMAGLNPNERSGNDGAYRVVLTLTVLSVYAVGPLLLGYGGAARMASRRRRTAAADQLSR